MLSVMGVEPKNVRAAAPAGTASASAPAPAPVPAIDWSLYSPAIQGFFEELYGVMSITVRPLPAHYKAVAVAWGQVVDFYFPVLAGSPVLAAVIVTVPLMTPILAKLPEHLRKRKLKVFQERLKRQVGEDGLPNACPACQATPVTWVLVNGGLTCQGCAAPLTPAPG